MIDLLCLSEFAWVVVWLGAQTRRKAVLYSVGVFTAGIAAQQFSGWITRVFTPPSSTVFRWFASQVSGNTQSVVLNSFIPPETAALTAASAPAQWIAYSILKTMFFVMLTLSIFLAFVIVSNLITALMDDAPVEPQSVNWKPMNVVFGILSGLYLLFLSTMALGNLAWLRVLSGVSGTVNNSMTMHLAALTLMWLKTHTLGV